MLSLKNSLAVLRKTDALLEGHFVLSSGLHSPQYVQCAKLLSKPTQAKKLISSLATKIKRNIKSFDCLLYTSPSPRDRQKSRMPSSA